MKKKVDLDILRARGSDPTDSFNSEIDHEWCAPAATQIVLDVLGLKNASDDFQRELVSRIGKWESWRRQPQRRLGSCVDHASRWRRTARRGMG